MAKAKVSTQFAQTLEKQHKAIRAIYLSSYIPRKCGIATFTKDLTNAVNAINPFALAEILAVADPAASNGYDYPWEVKYRMQQEDLASYLSAADYVNSSSAELLCLQHEFGLFGGKDGEYVLEFLKKIEKKVVTTLHTVPEKPSKNQLKVIKEIFKSSNVVVVMIEPVVNRLVKVYGVDRKKIAIIHHGVPDLPFGGTEHFKRLTRLSGKVVMSAINLISENKGLEYAIGAVEEIAKKVPNFLLLIIGETHPTVKKKQGESYRRLLKRQVKDLGVEDHVRFINRYLPLEELIDYLRASDLYVTPYLDPQQIASGTLSYAVGAGKVSISTPYLYAQEVLNGNRGILVPFRDSAAIAQASLKVLNDQNYRRSLEREAYQYGRLMTWPAVSLAYLDVFRLVLEGNRSSNSKG
jgi:glycosyltransferase involved in cell wall biosynthesis